MRRRLVIVSIVVAVLIIVIAVAVRTRNTADSVAAPSRTTTTTTAAVVTTEPACGTVATTTRAGDPIPESLRQLVTAVHDAACRRDVRALQALMEEDFGGRSSAEGAAALAARDGQPMAVLAEALETPAVVTQGGSFFCHPDGIAAVFPRGTLSRPGGWSAFSRQAAVAKACQG